MGSNRAAGEDAVSHPAGDPAIIAEVFDQVSLMVVAVEGPEQRIVAATGAYREYTGRPDLIGLLLRDAFAETSGQQLLPMFDRVYSSGQSEHIRGSRAQIDLPDSGESVEFFADINVYPRLGLDGAVVGVTADMVDVTEQVRERQAAQRKTAEAERRYAQARDVIDALQRELLPAGLPVLPQIQIAASYLLADADTAAGGDWFDALVLPDGRTALIVGDVVGHGVAASATMGQLRILLHEHLAATAHLPAALTALDTAAQRIRGAQAATACVVLLDPVTGVLEYCTAGHPPPVVVSSTGEARYLPATGAGPVGVGGAFTPESVGNDRLEDGELVLLYSDGILERPDRELAQSTVELAQAAGDIAAGRALRDEGDSPAERVCTQALELLVRVTGHSDDITLLAGQRTTPPVDLTAEYPAGTDQLGAVRERLDSWLADARVTDRDADALRHAVLELATNAIEHAYIDSAEHHTFTLTADLADTGQITVRVVDQGRWRTPAPSPDRGLGLQVVEGLVDQLQVDHDEHGTTATVSHRLSRPARLLDSGELAWAGAPRPARAELLLVLEQPSAPRPRIRVDGPVDAATVGEFDRGVRTAGSTGARSLTVDLTGVTHLASAGVAALYRLSALHRDNATQLRLYAPAESPAQMILSLIGLEHHLDDPEYPQTS